MVDLEKLEQFRTPKEPLSTLWSVGGEDAYGSLIWRNGSPYLRICIKTPALTMKEIHEKEIPIVSNTKPPIKSNIVGYTREFGTITLEECLQYNVKTTTNYESKDSITYVYFAPSHIWIGSGVDKIQNEISYVVARDHRLSGYFGEPGLKTHLSPNEKLESVFTALGQPDEIWTIKSPAGQGIKLKGTSFTLSVSSDISSSRSATKGYSIHSHLKISLHSEKATSINDASDILFRLEQIFSIFALEPFSFEIKEYYGDLNTPYSVSSVWHMGKNLTGFNPPMRHQILVDLTDHQTLQSVCDAWFDASDTVKLSRWLFVRALHETEDGLARFIGVTQSFEVLSREMLDRNKLPKSKMRRAKEIVEQGLMGEFEEDFVQRIVSLISSSNKISFRDALYSMLSAANPEPENDLLDFCKKVVEVRNDVIHMTDKSENSLNNAFMSVNKLSLQLSFWYSVLQAYQIGIKIPNINEFLFNNRNARHGLPNEVLESDV